MAKLNRSVVEARARGDVAADDALTALYRKLDFFPTPPWAARAVCELVKAIDPHLATAWEPAAGQGHFAEPARAYFHAVHASDVYDFQCGYAVNDFLVNPTEYECDWIISNPPFPHAQSFVDMGLRVARRGVAILVRLSFLATIGRHMLIYGYPADAACVFSERVAMQLGSWDPDGDTMTEYCAIVWNKSLAGEVRYPRLMAFPPGTKERLSRADDRVRFGPKRPQLNLEYDAPLLGKRV